MEAVGGLWGVDTDRKVAWRKRGARWYPLHAQVLISCAPGLNGDAALLPGLAVESGVPVLFGALVF